MSRIGAYVVTGSGSGIGQSIARKLVGQGHSVFGIGRDKAKLQRTVESLPAGRFVFASANLMDSRATAEALMEFRQWLGTKNLPLLGIVNNAGVFDRVAFAQTSDAVWERQFQSNLLSAVRLTRELYPDLKKSSPSSVLNISSTLGLRSIADTSAYSAIKAAMVNWTKTLAIEWAKDGIRANCICPGIVDTPIHDFHSSKEDDKVRLAAHAMQPLGRMGVPADIADAAWFLMSPSSSWTTGTVLSIDGGISL